MVQSFSDIKMQKLFKFRWHKIKRLNILLTFFSFIGIVCSHNVNSFIKNKLCKCQSSSQAKKKCEAISKLSGMGNNKTKQQQQHKLKKTLKDFFFFFC